MGNSKSIYRSNHHIFSDNTIYQLIAKRILYNISSDLESFIFSHTEFIEILIFSRLLTSKSIVSLTSTSKFGLNSFIMEWSLANPFRFRLESITLLIVLLYILNKFAPEHELWGFGNHFTPSRLHPYHCQ